MACPIIDFTEPSTATWWCGESSALPKTRRTVSSSAASPAAVAVPCPSTSPTDAGSSAAAW